MQIQYRVDDNGNPILGSETDSRQVFDRLSGCWRTWGENFDYFDNKEDAESAMLSLRTAQADNDDVLLFFYGVATSDTEFKVNLIMDVDTPLPPSAPEV